jgi:hypothetical protein
LTDRPAAALPPSYHLTETAFGCDLAVLISRRGGTDEFLGRGAGPRSRAAGNGGAADPWKSVWCSRELTPLAEPVRRSRKRVESRAVPVVTPWRKEISAPVHRPYLDRRGHKRVSRATPGILRLKTSRPLDNYLPGWTSSTIFLSIACDRFAFSGILTRVFLSLAWMVMTMEPSTEPRCGPDLTV